jgi:serine/threonine protein kinase/formylglycine-generating enzyme required for sulfatase activity/dienelactone hydrolase
MSKKSVFDLDPEQLNQLLSIGKETPGPVPEEQSSFSDVETQAAPTASLNVFTEKLGGQIGRTIGSFEIVKIIGRGGMGVVYLAHDTKLDRSVAVKSMPVELQASPTAQTRFVCEAKVLASLSHPNIGVIHDIIEQTEGSAYLVLEYVPGETLAERITKGPLKLQEALTIALQIAEAVAAAHEHNVIHRDLKPGNIKITPDGRVKVLDFGLAKTVGSEPSEKPATVTQPGRVIGTPAYMSPEQARGKPTDKRSDIWSFGCVLYEMLTGRIPFEGETVSDTLVNILDHDPDWQFLPREVGPQVRKVLCKCLEKDPGSRYQSVSRICQDLCSYQATLLAKAFDVRVVWRVIRRPQVAVCVILILLTLGFGLSRLMHRSSKVRWARVEAIPEIIHLIDQDKYFAAFSLARQAERYIPGDPVLAGLWPRMSRDYSVITTPPAADIFFREYSDTKGGWEYLGRSPLENIMFPRGVYRWKITKEGFETGECVPRGQTLNVELWEEGSFPPGMVRIPPSAVRLNLWPFYWQLFEAVEIPAYLIDQYEVTNEQFKRFVDDGSYEKQECWKHKFIIDGHELSWEQAMKEFRDKTGRPGPSTWEGGTFPKGKDKFPVSGVSWYEAAAYAEFAGKSLPTIYHWQKAACIHQAAAIIPLSNIKGEGLAPVGSFPGIGTTGLYDMAGNVKEWCWNVTDVSGEHRYILGGSWTDQTYMFTHTDSRSPWDRSINNGFRCVQYQTIEKATTDTLFGPIKRPYVRDYSKKTPVSDETFNSWLRTLYSYDRTELHAVVEEFDESSGYWRKEKVTFDAAYGGERVIAYLFLPKDIKPPYQTVIYFPGWADTAKQSSENITLPSLVESIIMSGRAFVYPVYKGTFERRFVEGAPLLEKPNAHRDWVIQFSKDLRRSIDYLETRDDIDKEKIAYYGLSWGGRVGSIMLALEERIKAGIIVLGGFHQFDKPPAVDEFNFTPRVKAPIIMIGGREDSIFPVKTSQIPMYELLGTADEDKEHKIYPGAHGFLPLFRRQIEGDVLDWLNRYLGPVD